VLAGCDDDSPDAAETTTTAVVRTTQRLTCPGGVSTAEVTGNADAPYANAGRAAQAEVDRNDDTETHALIGEEPAGVRYAMLNADGVVVEEFVFSDVGGTWAAVSHDFCGQAG
jgi:hypothetical protein